MLKKLETKNFRKLEDNVFEFGPGLQVVRGANEAGKSTMLEAIGYALFGAKACREALAQVVTWGKDEKSLAVTLWVEMDGEYVIKRSPRGAEVLYDGGRVVGQAEVTAFVAKLLGTDAAAATKLMLAPQGAIRGALDEGATKTMKLIEDLADFEIVDYVIELIQSNLLTGPTNVAEDRVKSAQAALEEARKAAVEPDTLGLDAKIAGYATTIKLRQEAIDKRLKPAFDAAQKAVNEANELARHRQTLRDQIVRIDTAQARRVKDIQAARAEAGKAPTATEIEAARAAVTVAENAGRERAIYEQFAALDFPEAYWEGDKASFEAEVRRAQQARHEAAYEVTVAKGEIRVLEAQRVTGTSCGYCGKDLSAVPEVVAKNAAIADKIAALQRVWSDAQRVYDAEASLLVDLDAVERAARPYETFLARYGDRVEEVGPKVYPPRLCWKGAEPKVVAIEPLRLKVQGLEAAARHAAEAAGRMRALEQEYARDDAVRAKLHAEYGATAPADVEARNAELAAAQAAWNDASGAVSEARYAKDQVEAEIKALKAAYEIAKRGVEAAEKALAQAQAELADLEFNNALLKRVRQARPVIADKLWSIVLAAVSTYFSQMRGTKSVVTREGNEFKVDGRPIEGLSGSTLDILGLAIRLALTRTFLPNSPLLILDEPAAAMDLDRTANTMGFLTAAGFKQTLVVTHEDQTESAAANLITL